jgi:hypothetical protein
MSGHFENGMSGHFENEMSGLFPETSSLEQPANMLRHR